jgi:uncharacterized protein YsxB (DUF464 family)
MTKINIFRDNNNNIKQLIVQNHTNYAKKGKDIICSGISAIIQTAILGLKKYSPAEVNTFIKEGFVKIIVNKPTRESNIILETARLGFLDIQRDYKTYIEVKDTV